MSVRQLRNKFKNVFAQIPLPLISAPETEEEDKPPEDGGSIVKIEYEEDQNMEFEDIVVKLEEELETESSMDITEDQALPVSPIPPPCPSSSPPTSDVASQGAEASIDTSPLKNIAKKKKTEDNSYFCPTCNKKFCKAALNRHIFVHLSTEEKDVVRQGWQNKCYFCSKRFRIPSHLEAHLSVHTRETPYKCHKCRKQFSRFATLASHKRLHKADTRFKCNQCQKSFTQKGTLNAHIKIVHLGIKPFQCSECDDKFGYKSNMLIHIDRVHRGIHHVCRRPTCARNFTCKGLRPFQCNQCKKSFTLKSSLKLHINTIHLRIKEFQCSECAYKCQLKGALLRHVNAVHRGIRYVCQHPSCDKSFSKDGLRLHEKKFHPKQYTHMFGDIVKLKEGLESTTPPPALLLSSPPTSQLVASQSSEASDDLSPTKNVITKNGYSNRSIPCSTCNKRFSTKQALTGHLYVHLSPEEKEIVRQGWPNKCYFCSKRFQTPSLLEFHLLVHTTEMPYKCRKCKKRFSHPYSLAAHKRLHNPATRLQCNQCKKSFTQRGSLKLHIKTVHLGIKPFQCSECDDKFGRKENMLQHFNVVHRGIKPFKCSECDYKCGVKGDMLRHINAIHLGIRYVCHHPTCNKSFAWKTALRNHVKQVHPSIQALTE